MVPPNQTMSEIHCLIHVQVVNYDSRVLFLIIEIKYLRSRGSCVNQNCVFLWKESDFALLMSIV